MEHYVYDWKSFNPEHGNWSIAKVKSSANNYGQVMSRGLLFLTAKDGAMEVYLPILRIICCLSVQLLYPQTCLCGDPNVDKFDW